MHLLLKLKRKIIPAKVYLFYLDLLELKIDKQNLPKDFQLERIKDLNSLNKNDFHKLYKYLGKKKYIKKFQERLSKKNTYLYFYNIKNEFVGYIWTTKGSYIAPYYFPSTSNDVFLLDTVVFPKYRGQGITAKMIDFLFYELRKEGGTRAFSSVAAWNHSSLNMVKKTKYKFWGIARKIKLFNYTVTIWYDLS